MFLYTFNLFGCKNQIVYLSRCLQLGDGLQHLINYVITKEKLAQVLALKGVFQTRVVQTIVFVFKVGGGYTKYAAVCYIY